MVSVKNRRGKLVCKVDPKARLIEIVRSRERTVICLIDSDTVLVTNTLL
jgi:hypothetical protein